MNSPLSRAWNGIFKCNELFQFQRCSQFVRVSKTDNFLVPHTESAGPPRQRDSLPIVCVEATTADKTACGAAKAALAGIDSRSGPSGLTPATIIVPKPLFDNQSFTIETLRN